MSDDAIFVALLVTVQAMAVLAAFRAVTKARTPQGAVGWVVFLLAAPYVALPLYVLFGSTRLSGYVTARRSTAQVVRALNAQGIANLARAGQEPAADGTVEAFRQLAAMPVVSGNAARLLVDGEATFDAMFAAIERARSYVLVQFYIIRDDRVGRALRDLLVARAQAGCRVCLLYDAVGCHDLPQSYLDKLSAAGVGVQNFHSLSRALNRFRLDFRNHRKIVVVDGQVGFLGGINVGDEYLGRDARLAPWRDTHLMLRGPVVAQLQLIFLEDWAWSTEERLDLDWEPAREEEEENRDALIVASGPADTIDTGTLHFCNAIAAARERIWIASAYFVPDTETVRMLQLAALRGVDVRILVPERRDHLLVWLAAFAYFDEVRDVGVQVLRYGDGFMHQKVMVVDERFASVGTMNLDNRSCRLNFEVSAIVFDAGFAREVAAMLERDFARSRRHDQPLSEASLTRRYGAPLARLLAPLL